MNDEKKKDLDSNNINEEEEKENEEIEEEEEKKLALKTYAHYKVSLIKYYPFIIIIALTLNLFYLLTIFNLLKYTSYLKKIIKDESLTYIRIKTLNDIILSINMVLVINKENFLGNNSSIIKFIKKSSETEEKFREIINNIDKNSNIYSTIIAYDKNNPCNYFNGFGIQYNNLQCEHYIIPDGLSFQISQTINDLNKIYIKFKTFNTQNNTVCISDMYMNNDIINLMIQNNFFIRFFLNDISVTYYESYIEIIIKYIDVVHIKFYVFIFILLASIVCYRFIFVKHIKKTVNNLSRIKVFFDDDTFEILI